MLRTWILAILLVACGSMVWADSGSAFVRVPLGQGASIEVPKNWEVITENERQNTQAYVEAIGAQPVPAHLAFMAKLFDDAGKTVALVHVRFYPDNPLTQAQARQLMGSDLKEFDKQIRRAAEAPLSLVGSKLTKWNGTFMQEANGLAVIVHAHEQSMSDGGGPIRSQGIRVLNAPRSFTVTISYRIARETMLIPIVKYMANSIRQQ